VRRIGTPTRHYEAIHGQKREMLTHAPNEEQAGNNLSKKPPHQPQPLEDLNKI
jgi:hypothetical protein